MSEIDPKALEAARLAYKFTSNYPIVPANHDTALLDAVAAYLAALSTPEQKTPDVEAVAWQARHDTKNDGKWIAVSGYSAEQRTIHANEERWEYRALYPAAALNQLRREIIRQQALVSSSEAERVRSCSELRTRAEKAEAAVAVMREALKPFADVGRTFSWAIGPDGIDDGMTVIVEPVARREWATHLSTADFTRAAALSHEPNGGGE